MLGALLLYTQSPVGGFAERVVGVLSQRAGGKPLQWGGLQDGEGRTPLMLAAHHGNVWLVKWVEARVACWLERLDRCLNHAHTLRCCWLLAELRCPLSEVQVPWILPAPFCIQSAAPAHVLPCMACAGTC